MGFRRLFALLLLAAAILPAQTVVEYTITTAGAATAATGMRGLGDSAAGIMQKAASTLDADNQSIAAGVRTQSATAAGRAGAATGRARSATGTVANDVLVVDSAPVVVKLSPPPDPASVKIGMTAQEALAKFGPPAMKLSSADGSHAAETWSYGSDPNTVTLTLRDGKVAEVYAAPREKAENEQAVVVILQ
jgi:hypothetical protein